MKVYFPNIYQVLKAFQPRLIKMSSIMEFNAMMFVSEQLERQLVNAAQDLAHRCVYECSSWYGFDANEAVRRLGLAMVRMERKSAPKAKVPKAPKVTAPKAAFPLPYNGEFNEHHCFALRQNNGLYTQCTSLRKGEASYCKSCASVLKKTCTEVPEYGTIQQRQEVGIFEYVDPKGRRPVAYTKVMKKYKITKEQVLEEAGKFDLIINENHFVEPEDTKRGRPKANKAPKVKGTKGRPKKEKKVLAIEGDEEDDLISLLVAEANNIPEEEEDNEIIVAPKSKKSGKSSEDKEAERLAKEAEKEAKKLAAEQAKKEKEEKLAAEKAAKEAKKEEERLAREAKKLAEEQEKAAKKLAAEKAKKEKEDKLAAEKAAKEASKTQKTTKKPAKKEEPEEEEEEPDVVKKIEFEGKKYFKSKNTGIIYDYEALKKSGEQIIIGKWNDKTNKIDFSEDGEESEEEYDD